jgi:hypothetical protein
MSYQLSPHSVGGLIIITFGVLYIISAFKQEIFVFRARVLRSSDMTLDRIICAVKGMILIALGLVLLLVQ